MTKTSIKTNVSRSENPFTSNTTLKTLAPNPYNVEAKEEYTFNRTGNIMDATTDINSGEVEQTVRKTFQEVAVFFAAMTKAMDDTDTSLYDVAAIRKIIDGSGLFVHVTQEQVKASYTDFSANFSQELIESLLGLATGTGEMAFASAMIKSIGSHGFDVSGGHSSSSSEVGNIVFVCEYILGMAIVSAIVVSCDAHENATWFKVGPCITGHEVYRDLYMTKDTYLFVAPAAIKAYSGDLESVETDAEYQALINDLIALLDPGHAAPIFQGVYPAGDSQAAATKSMTKDSIYQMTGKNFGAPSGGALAFTGEQVAQTTIQIVNWTPTNILFKPTQAAAKKTIEIYSVADAVADKKPTATTTEIYSVT